MRLRPLAADDFEPLRLIAADPLLWEQHPSKERSERAGFERWFDDAIASGGALTAEDATTGAVIGTSRYDGHDPDAREVEIGWTFLDRARWGGPDNAEMKCLMLDHAYRWVDTVLFRVHSDNHRSQRAVAKLGATRRGTEVDRWGRGENLVLELPRLHWVVRSFNAAITAQDLDALVSRMTDDHAFVDSAGQRVDGKASCRDAWRSFFEAFPDYRNELEHLAPTDQTVAIRGRSHCSVAALDGPALWRAVVDGNRLAEWRVHEDTPANRAALGLAE